MRIEIIDRNPAFVQAAERVIAGTIISVSLGSIIDGERDAVVSPANSFGFMDGGVDMAYSQRFGWGVQERLQAAIKALPFRELLVGQALAVETEDKRIPWLISAPTMRVPKIIADPADVMLAARAATAEAGRLKLKSIAFPGMGTGCGRLDFRKAAEAMWCGIIRARLEEAGGPIFPISWQDAQKRHFELAL